MFDPSQLLGKIYPNVWRLLAIATTDFTGTTTSLVQDAFGDTPPYSNPATPSGVGWIKFEYGFNSIGEVKTKTIDGKAIIQTMFLKTIKTPTHIATFVSEADRNDINFREVNNHGGDIKYW